MLPRSHVYNLTPIFAHPSHHSSTLYPTALATVATITVWVFSFQQVQHCLCCACRFCGEFRIISTFKSRAKLTLVWLCGHIFLRPTPKSPPGPIGRRRRNEQVFLVRTSAITPHVWRSHLSQSPHSSHDPNANSKKFYA